MGTSAPSRLRARGVAEIGTTAGMLGPVSSRHVGPFAAGTDRPESSA
jgi:hypothetical protein